ncbi:hypothetical protein JOQ06_020491, partial [Pogonophryne albipinna]
MTLRPPSAREGRLPSQSDLAVVQLALGPKLLLLFFLPLNQTSSPQPITQNAVSDWNT